jgi:type IV pilus assembly protein PilA
MPRKSRSGFTLIELLVVIGIISLLATIVIVALNPAVRFAEARNARRWGDVNSILTAVHEYIVDNDGTIPTGITTSLQQLGTCVSGGATACTGAAAACVDLSTNLAPYLKTIPIDPSAGSASTTKFSVIKDANNIITVNACAAEQSETIQVSR